MDNVSWPVRPEDVYDDSWREARLAYLKTVNWEFRPPKKGETFLYDHPHRVETIVADWNFAHCVPYFVILGKKTPPAPQLTDIYGSDTVTIPEGYAWTGEFRQQKNKEYFLTLYRASRFEIDADSAAPSPRLILRQAKTEKEEFVANPVPRIPKEGDYVIAEYDQVELYEKGFHTDCTRIILERRVITTPAPASTVTQADVDREWAARYDKTNERTND